MFYFTSRGSLFISLQAAFPTLPISDNIHMHVFMPSETTYYNAQSVDYSMRQYVTSLSAYPFEHDYLFRAYSQKPTDVSLYRTLRKYRIPIHNGSGQGSFFLLTIDIYQNVNPLDFFPFKSESF